jgi:hypothetical protein
MRRLPFRTGAIVLAASALLVTDLSAQLRAAPNRGGFTESLGLPSRVRWNAGATVGVNRTGNLNEAVFYGFGGVYRDLINPAIQALGIQAEAYGGRQGTFEDISEGWDGGLRIGLGSPVARLFVGADYNFNKGEFDTILSLIHPVRRGGLFGNGSSLRIDYIPGRSHTTGIGISVPIGSRFVGKTRPRADYAVLDQVDVYQFDYVADAETLEAVGNAGQFGEWLTRLTIPFVDHYDSDFDEGTRQFVEEMDEIRTFLATDGAPLIRGRKTSTKVVEAYHAEIVRAFSIVTNGRALAPGEATPLGEEVWDKAREVILEEVILPYNRLLGRKKKNDSTRSFDTRATAAFYEWLTRETPVDEERLRGTAWVFARVLDLIEGVREDSLDRWGDNRYVFLPLQLALLPEEHDEQTEIDALVARAVEERWTIGNHAWYVENEQFQVEHARMVLEAEDYHVLWIHDVRGNNGAGDPDAVGYHQSVDVYLRALINAVNRYDQTGKIPQYIIILDQWFYQANNGRLWMELLQDPLHHEMDLPAGYEEWERRIREVQDELRQAVADSRLLQAQALHFKDGWIENVVKVHVNITNPADVAFWTGELLPIIGLPDMIARDHRKISFFDATEADPFKGQAMYTGMGLGEHYVGAGWEDRALMAQGPSILSLKTAARQLFYNQGFEEDEIPWELRPDEMPEDYQEQTRRYARESGSITRAMQIHNEIGYNSKRVNVAKATLYTLMPPGSIIKAPDSLWNLPLWGSMMLGNALRGGHSLIIAPAIDHAPSAGFPQMSRAQELLGRMVISQEVFGDHLAATGGLMKVGLYRPSADAGNIPAKMDQMVATYESTPWLATTVGLSRITLESLKGLAQALEDEGYERRYGIPQDDVPPKLHLKAHMYAAPEAWNGMLSGPAGAEFLMAAFRALAEQNALLAGEGTGRPTAEGYTAEIIPPAVAMVERQVERLGGEGSPQERRAAMYFMVGSHNQNYRSLILDGEVAFVISGGASIHGLADFVMLAGLSEWVDTMEEMEALFPRYEGMQRKLGRWMRIVV